MKRTVRQIWRGVLLVGVSIGGLLFAVPSASADPGCAPVVGWCSSSVNDSAFSATALFNWCTGGSTGDSTATRPTCSSGGVAQKTYSLSPRGGHTPYSEDWDTLQIDAGWCYRVKFVITAGTDFTRTYNRIGTSALYVKVADDADAHVQAQASSSCP